MTMAPLIEMEVKRINKRVWEVLELIIMDEDTNIQIGLRMEANDLLNRHYKYIRMTKENKT